MSSLAADADCSLPLQYKLIMSKITMHTYTAIFFVVFSSYATTAHAPSLQLFLLYTAPTEDAHYLHCATALYITMIVISLAMETFPNFECSYIQVVSYGPWQHIQCVQKTTGSQFT